MKEYQRIENININMELGKISETIEYKKDKDTLYYTHKIISNLLVGSVIVPNIYLVYIMLF
jgi:hypothetical protein